MSALPEHLFVVYKKRSKVVAQINSKNKCFKFFQVFVLINNQYKQENNGNANVWLPIGRNFLGILEVDYDSAHA